MCGRGEIVIDEEDFIALFHILFYLCPYHFDVGGHSKDIECLDRKTF